MGMRELGLKIVEFVEIDLKDNRPCPLCLLYGGGHQSHCPYLFFYSWKISPETTEVPEETKKSKTSVITADYDPIADKYTPTDE